MKLELKDLKTLRFTHPLGGEAELRYAKVGNLEIKIAYDEMTNAYSYSIIDSNNWSSLSWREKEKQVHSCDSFEDGLAQINKILEEKKL